MLSYRCNLDGKGLMSALIITAAIVFSPLWAFAAPQVSFTQESTTLSVGEEGAWKVTITNPDEGSITDATLVVTLPNDFTVTNNGGATESTSPTHSLTWTGLSLSGNGGVVDLTYSARPNCGAETGQIMSANFNSSAATATSSSITVGYPQLSLQFADSSGSTVTTAAKGDSVTWLLTLTNSGTGALGTGADISFTLGAGFSFLSISSSSSHNTPTGGLTPGAPVAWNTGLLEAGDSAVYEIAGTVAGCNLSDLINSVRANWSDGQDNCLGSDLTGSTSIALATKEPNISITVNNPGLIPYCSGATASITVSNSSGTGAAENFTLRVQGWPPEWAVSGVTNGVTWDGDTSTFDLSSIAAGESLIFKFNIDPAAGCSVTNSATLLFLPNYTNDCGVIYGTEYFTPVTGPQTWTMEPSVSPTITVVKTGPNNVNVGDTGLVYTITVTYSGPSDVLPYTATITDDYPDSTQTGLNQGFTVVDAGGGTDNGGAITWSHTFNASPETVTYTVIMNAPTDPCSAFAAYNNAVTVAGVPDDCRGCPGVIHNATLPISVVDTNGSVMAASSITANSALPADVCTNVTFTTSYTFDSGAPANWDGIILHNEITPSGFAFVAIDSVKVNGTEYKAYLGPVFPLNLSALSTVTAAPNSGATIAVTYTYSVENSEGRFYVHSSLDVPGSGTQCASSPEFDVREEFEVWGTLMELAAGGTPSLLSTCEAREFTITIGGNDRVIYNPKVTLDTRNVYSYLGSAAFSEVRDASGNAISAFEPTDNGDGTYTWDFASHTVDGSGDILPQGVIRFRMQHDCSTATATWETRGVYGNRCENGSSPSRSASDSASPLVLTDGIPTFRLNPVSVFAYSPYVSDRIEIVNGGSGPLYDVDVTITLAADIVYRGTYMPVTGSVGPDSVSGSAGDHTVVFHWNRIDPGKAEYLDLDLRVTGCSALDITGQLVWGCDAGGCDLRNASAVVLLPETSVIIVGHTGESLDPCNLRDAAFQITGRNSGKTDAHNAKVVEWLPPGVTLIAGSSTFAHADGYDGLTGSPTVTTQDVSGRQEITWDFSSVLPLNADGDRAMKPGSSLQVNFSVEVADCSAPDAFLASNRQAVARAWFDPPCNASGGGASASAPNSLTTTAVNPQVSVLKKGRNLTKGTAWQSTEVAADGEDTVEWEVTYSNSGDYVASAVRLWDTLPANVLLVPGSLSASGCTIDAVNYFGAGQAIGNLAVGATCTLTFRTFVIGCTDTVATNTAWAAWGCCPDTAADETSSDATNLRTRPQFGSGQAVVTDDWTTCGGTVRITLTNTGATALTDSIVDTLPAGYVYDAAGTCSIVAANTPSEMTHATLVCTPSITGQVLTWDSTRLDFVAPGETITITFAVKADGTYCDTTKANDSTDPFDVPVPTLTNQIAYGYHDSCNSTPVYVTAQDTVDPTQPDIDIAITPAQQDTTEGSPVSWTITLTNKGDAPAANITLTDVLGSGFSAVSDNGGGSWVGTTGTWTIPGPVAANGGTWAVTVTATVGTGSLSNHATVEGWCKDAAGTDTCTYTHDEAEAFTAAFLVEKTVDKAMANIGELLTYDLRVVYSNTERFLNPVVTDTMETYLEFIDAVAQADSDFTSVPSVSGNVLSWNLGDFNGNKTFHYLVRARVTNNSSLEGGMTQGDTLATQFEIDFNGDSTPDAPFSRSESVSTEITEPILLFTKSISPNTGLQAGDTVTITLEVKNTGSGPAYKVKVLDLLNDTDNDGDVDGNDTTVYNCGSLARTDSVPDFNFAVSGTDPACLVSYESSGDTPILANGFRSFTFTAQIATSAVTGSMHINQANTEGWSLKPSDPGTTNTAYDRKSSVSDTDYLLTSASSVSAKAVTATSEPTTTGTNLAVGEVATYEIRFQIPAGTTRDVRLYDRLTNITATPWGAYVAGSAKLARESTDLSCTLNPGGINAAGPAINVSVDGSVSTDDASSSYRFIQLDLGDVTNASGTTLEYILTLDVVVMNNSVTNAGAALTDVGRLRWANQLGTYRYVNSSSLSRRVVEPVPSVTKTAQPATGQAGDTITFTLEICNQAVTYPASAFDWQFIDPLSADYENPGNVTINAGSTGASGSASFTGNILNGAIDQLDPGECVSVTYEAQLAATVEFAKSVSNTVVFTTTSLPGGHGTGGATPGNPGEATGERTGSGTGANDLYGSATAAVTINTPSISKDTVNFQSYYAVGERPRFLISLGAPSGTANLFVVNDQLPSGLAFAAGTLQVTMPTGASATNSPLTEENLSFFSYNQSAGTMVFNFGTITVPTAGNILIEYQADVENVLTNQDGTTLTNSARLTYEDPAYPWQLLDAGPVDNQHPVRVGEPNLDLTKTATAGATGADAGDTVAWQVVIQNTGHTTAYQVDWKDVLPVGLYRISTPQIVVTGGNIYLNGTTTGVASGHLHIKTTTSDQDTLDLADTGQDDATDTVQMDPGAQMTITFDSVLMDTVSPGQVLNNRIRASYTSLVDGGRDNSSGAGTVDDDDDSVLDNYEESADQSVTVAADIAIDKTAGKTQAAVGETVIFTLRVDVIEGTTPDLKVYDILPAGLTYVDHSFSMGNMNMGFGNASYGTRLGSGREVHFELGDVTNPADTYGDNDYFTLAITARVDNIAENQDQSVLKNGENADGSQVYLTYGSSRLDFDHDTGAPGLQGLPLTVVEPDLAINKTVSPASQSLGDIVTFTITVTHGNASSSDAYGVEITDTLPAGLTYLDCVLPPGSVSQNGQNLTFTKASLTRAAPDSGQWQFSYRARIDADAVAGRPLTNAAHLTWNSTPDATGEADSGRNGDDGLGGALNDYAAADTATVMPGTAAFIEAVKTVALTTDADASGNVTPGDRLTYTVVLHNENGDATGVVFTDPIPLHTGYVPGSLSTTKGTLDTSGLPASLAVHVDELASDEAVTITFQVTVEAGTPDGTVLSNQGLVDSDQTVPEPTDADGIDQNGAQPTEVVVGGSPQAAGLYVWKLVEWKTDADSSGDITGGDTMTYWVVFYNTGSQALTGVSFADSIPAGLTHNGTSGNSDGGSLSITGSQVGLTGMTLGAGDYEYIWFEVTVDGWTAPPATRRYANRGTASSDQTASMPSDGNGDQSDGYQETVFESVVSSGTGGPSIDVQKRWVLASDLNGNGLVDSGDTIRYLISITNQGSAAASDVRFEDSIPAYTHYVAGSIAASQGVVVAESPALEVNIGTVSPGDVVTIGFLVTIDAGSEGHVISNQARVSGDGGIDEPSDDNGSEDDGKNPTLTPVDVSGGFGGPSGLAKTLFATSEENSLGSAVMIGEVVTFRVAFDVPPGQVLQTTLLDTLPEGLAYIEDSARLARVFDTGLNSQLNPGDINSAASGAFANLTDGSDIKVSGKGLSVALGDIINSDNDANSESYILELKAVVENTAANQAGATLSNQGGLSYFNGLSQLQNLTPADRDVTVIEPDIRIEKNVDPHGILPAGGTVQFAVNVTNQAQAADAYDVRIIDTLPAQFSSMTVIGITPSGGVTGIIDNSSGTVLDLRVGHFPAAGGLLITYRATAPGPLQIGTITNTATATWTSLPGAQGSGDQTPGSPGDSNGERTGSGQGPNDYAGGDSADLMVGSVGLAKSIISGAGRYAVGDTVRTQVVITLPGQLSADNSRFEDVLDEGLSYVAGSLQVTPASGVTLGLNPTEFTRTDDSPSAGYETLALAWGTVSNSTGTAATITVQYDALVDNVLLNQDNHNLSNNVALTFDVPGGTGTSTISDSASVTVGEPHLATAKTITSAVTGLDAGDPIDFQVEVTNNGTTSAYEVVLSDSLPGGLEQVTDLRVMSSSGGAETPSLSNNGTGWTTTGFDIPVGGSVIIGFSARLSVGVVPGQQIQNTVGATFTSRDGTDPDERDGSTATSDQDDDTKLNNYNDSGASPVVTVADPVQINKRFHPVSTKDHYTIGELFQYRLTVHLLEGTIRDLVVTDTLPEGIAYIASAVGVGHLGMTTGYGGVPSQNGQVIEYDLGDVVNPGNGNTGDDFITIDLTVQVLNQAGNLDGHVFGNNARLTFTGPSGTETRDYDSDANTSGVQPLDGVITEPKVEIRKTATPTTVPPGGELTFTIRLDHGSESSADAYDLVVVDTLPAGLTYLPGSASIPVTVVGQDLTFEVAALTLADDHTSFTFRARVDADTAFGATLINTTSLAYSSRPGTVSEERSYSATDTADVRVGTAAFIEAVKTVALTTDADASGNVTPGDRLTYTVVLHNENGDATGVVFTDPIPLHTGYVPGSLSTTKGTLDTSGLPASLAVHVDELASDEAVTITFQVTVEAGTPDGTVLSNQGLVDSDQTVPEPTDADGIDQNGAQPTEVVVGGSPQAAGLYVWKLVEWKTDADSSGDITGGDTMTYWVVFYNTGSQALTGVSFADSIPAGLTHNGTSGNSDGGSLSITGSQVGLTGMTLGAGDYEYIWFEVTVDGWTAPPATRRYANRGTASSDQTGSMPSDGNGDQSDGYQETVFESVASSGTGGPSIDVQKRWRLVGDSNADAEVNPGEMLEYTIAIGNSGSSTANDVRLQDPIPANTSLVAGSVVASQGLVLSEDPMSVNIGSIEPGAWVTVTFRVVIFSALPTGTSVANTATVTLSGQDPVDAIAITDVVSRPNVYDPPNFIKTVDANGFPVLTYEAVLINSGTAPAVNVIFTDPIPTNTSFVAGSILLNGVPVPDGEGFTGTAVRVLIPSIDALGGQVSIKFSVRVEGGFHGTISNQATVVGDNLDEAVSDDPGTDQLDDQTGYQADEPTKVPVLDGRGTLLMATVLLLAALTFLRSKRRRDDC